MTELITSEKSALFLQMGMGSRPLFRGLHTFTGDMTKSDGTITPIYYWDAGEAFKVAETRATPEPVTVTLDAPLQSIADLVGSKWDCPIHLIMITDNCLAPDLKRSWGRWGATDPQIMLLIPNAKIEQRTLSNLMSREGNQNMPMGSIQIKFDTWTLIKGGNPVSLTVAVNVSNVVGVTPTTRSGCQDPECGGVEGCSVWYAAAAGGGIWRRNGNAATWTALTVTSPWVTNDGGIYADNRLVLVGGDAGIAAAYGVQRSIDGGVTFSKVTFGTAGGGVTGTVSKIARHNEDFFAFTATGIWRSVNDGLTWTLMQAGAFLSGAFDSTGLGAAVTASAVYTSRDSGLTWGTVTAVGTATKDATFAGGYLYVADSVAGIVRVATNSVRSGTAIAWTVMDTTTGVTDILFVNTQLGYRLRGAAVDRTLNGGYSWESLSVTGSAPTWAQMMNCGGRLGLAGGMYFGYYSPFFDSGGVAYGAGFDSLDWNAWETPAGSLKLLYDNNAIDVATGLPSDYAAGNGPWQFTSFVTQEFNGSLFIGLSNVPMNGTGAIVVRLDTPGGTPVFEYNLPEEGVQRMAVNPAGTALYVVGPDAHGAPELCGIYKRDLAGVWTKRATLDASWWHVLGLCFIGSRLFVCGQGTPNIAYSDDDGTTWTYPSAPGSVNRVYAIGSIGSNLIAAGYSGSDASLPFEMFLSVNSGATWLLLYSSMVEGSSGNFVEWNSLAVYRIGVNKLATINSAGIFTQVTVPFDCRTGYNTIATLPGGYLCVLGTTGVWRTSDLVTWEKIWKPMPGTDTNSNSSISIKVLGSWANDVVVSTNGILADLRGRQAT